MNKVSGFFLKLAFVFSFLILSFSSLSSADAKEALKEGELLKNVLNGIVEVNVEVIKAPYSVMFDKPPSEMKYNGFLANKKLGLVVLTDGDVSNKNRIEVIKVKFANKKECIGVNLYTDVIYGFSIIKVPVSEIPEDAVELKVNDAVAVGDKVYAIEKNGDKLSQISGFIKSSDAVTFFNPFAFLGVIFPEEVTGLLAPVVYNERMEVVGSFDSPAASESFHHITYVEDALKAIHNGASPKNRSVGIAIQYVALSFIPDAYGISEEKLREYYGDNSGFAQLVFRIDPYTPADGVLKAGDLILSVDDKPLTSGNPHAIKKILDSKKGDKARVKFRVFRNGAVKDVSINTYDVSDYEVKEMITWLGATFVESDSILSAFFGIPKNRVVITHVFEDSAIMLLRFDRFKTSYTIAEVISIDGVPVNSLSDLKKIIREKSQKDVIFFSVKYPYLQTGTFNCHTSNLGETAEIALNRYYSGSGPLLYKYSSEHFRWDVKDGLENGGSTVTKANVAG